MIFLRLCCIQKYIWMKKYLLIFFPIMMSWLCKKRIIFKTQLFTYSWLSLCWIQKYISITKILADIFLNHSSKKRQNFIITIFLWISYYLLPSALMCKMHIGLVRSLTLWFSFQTNSGTVLISINPYKKLPFYTPDVIDIYRCHCLYALPPHM